MIIRGRRSRNFTVLDNALLGDMSISWAAKGVLVYLLSKPDDWAVRPEQLIRAGQSGKHAIYRILGELDAAGYARKARARTGSGQFQGYDWMIYDYPYTEIQDMAERQARGAEKDQQEQDVAPYAENQDTGSEAPYPDFPYPDNPYPENQTLLKTDLNKELSAAPPARAPAREAGDSPADPPDPERHRYAPPADDHVPAKPADWGTALMQQHRYARHEVLAAKPIALFRDWCNQGLTWGLVHDAIEAAHARNGERPASPVYYRGFVADMVSARAAAADARTVPFARRQEQPAARPSVPRTPLDDDQLTPEMRTRIEKMERAAERMGRRQYR